MPEQNTPDISNENVDPIAESEDLLNALKQMVEGGAASQTTPAAGTTDEAAATAADAVETAAATAADAAETAAATAVGVADAAATTAAATAAGVTDAAAATAATAPAAPQAPYATTSYAAPGQTTAAAAPEAPYAAPAAAAPETPYASTPATPAAAPEAPYASTAASQTPLAAEPTPEATTKAAPDVPSAYASATDTDAQVPAPKKSKTGLIIGLIVAALVIAGIAFALTQMGSCSIGANDETQIKNAVAATMDELANPTAEAKAELAEGISEGFEMTAGFDLQDLGITPEEYADWVLSGISYEVGDTTYNADEGTGSSVVTVTSRNMSSFNSKFAEEIAAMSENGLGDVDSYEALYAKIGEAMKAAMEKTETGEQNVTFDVIKTDNGWVVSDDSKEACFSSILAGN